MFYYYYRSTLNILVKYRVVNIFSHFYQAQWKACEGQRHDSNHSVSSITNKLICYTALQMWQRAHLWSVRILSNVSNSTVGISEASTGELMSLLNPNRQRGMNHIDKWPRQEHCLSKWPYKYKRLIKIMLQILRMKEHQIVPWDGALTFKFTGRSTIWVS